MKRTRLMVVMAFSASAMAMSGCGKSLKDYAKVAQNALGIPVELKTTDADVCARRQLDKVVDDYRALSSDEQDAVKGFAHRYQSIVINASATTARVSGDVTILQLVQESAFNGPYVAQTKVLADHRHTDGTAPKTQADKGTSLAITTQNAFDDSTTTTYATRDSGIFTLITDDGATLQQALTSGLAVNQGSQASPIVSCGDLLGLRDLL